MLTASRKILLEFEEELKFLELLVIDDSSISIVGVVSSPLEESLAFVSDCTEVESSGDASDLMSWLSRDDLVAEGVLHI